MTDFDWGEFLLISLGGLAAAALALVVLRAIVGPPPYSTALGLIAIVIGIAPFVVISRWRRRKS